MAEKRLSVQELIPTMATQFAHAVSSPEAVPFLFARSAPTRPAVGFSDAVKRAVAIEAVRKGIRKPSQRVALFLCELGKACGGRSDYPLSRSDIANVLGIGAVRVKRTLAMLALSGVLSCDGERIRVLDWRKLSGAARIDPAELDLAAEDEDDLPASAAAEDEDTHLLTVSGDPACFV